MECVPKHDESAYSFAMTGDAPDQEYTVKWNRVELPTIQDTEPDDDDEALGLVVGVIARVQ